MLVDGKSASSSVRATPRRLDWVEVGRGLAALGVVIAHYNPTPNSGLFVLGRDLGSYAVEFFFTLSGFIIFFVHGRELGQPEALGRYGWRRLCRVLPTYWIMLAAALVFNQTIQNPSARIHLNVVELLRQTFLIPNTDLLIGPAWTLRHELLFYAMFALIIVSRRFGLAIFAAWMVACLANLVIFGLPPGQIWTPEGIFFHHYNLDFACGMAIALAARRPILPALTAIAGAIGIVLCGLSATLLPHAVLVNVLGHKALFCGILGLLVLLSRRGVEAPGWGVRLGAMSYALYISHITVGVAFNGALKHLHVREAIPIGLLFAIDIAVAVTFAGLFFSVVEKPMLKRLYAAWDARRPTPERIAPAGTVAADQGV
ncbi:acyltransferase family protein [Sphingomonas nostoxanthinifaciens]|uniref:acyltransferase family protein n=1 Tax=Sphingomonas nostoxanthinifaciens TaxID=2872652 RepID=UPI001CC1CC81|nr:acyltransferase [Sphingomonas nostoxanthinifaciens]